jgi:hypothetical protein
VPIWAGHDLQSVPGPFRIGQVEGLSFDANKQTMRWSESFGSDRYDVIRGNLGLLHSSQGDFAASLPQCLAEDNTDLDHDDSAVPQADEAFYYLVRGQGCGPDGTFDSYPAWQVGLRDAEINGSTGSCN